MKCSQVHDVCKEIFILNCIGMIALEEEGVEGRREMKIEGHMQLALVGSTRANV